MLAFATEIWYNMWRWFKQGKEIQMATNVDIVIRARMDRDACIRRRGSMSIVMMKNIASGAGLQVMVRGVCILRRRSIGMVRVRTSAFGVVRRRRVQVVCIRRRAVTRNNPRQIFVWTGHTL